MAYLVRKNSEEFYFAMAKAFRELRALSGIVGSNFHRDLTSVVTTGSFREPVAATLAITAANATDLATSLTLAAQIDYVFRAMIADDNAHKVKDTNVPANAIPTDLSTALTWANDVKSKYNTHIASTTYHYTADATNTIAAANATDQTSLNTLLNELKTDMTAHIAGAPAAHGIALVGP